MKDNFEIEVKNRILKNSRNKKLKSNTQKFFKQSILDKYSYNFNWMERPIIQYPQDIVAIQEIIWKVNPDLISPRSRSTKAHTRGENSLL